MSWRVIAVLVLASFSLAQDSNGPFGLRGGMTRKQVEQAIGAKALVSADGDDVTYSRAPQPHPDFNSYKLTFSRTYGLVRLIAQSKDIDEDETLAATSAKCEEIQAALTAKSLDCAEFKQTYYFPFYLVRRFDADARQHCSKTKKSEKVYALLEIAKP